MIGCEICRTQTSYEVDGMCRTCVQKRIKFLENKVKHLEPLEKENHRLRLALHAIYDNYLLCTPTEAALKNAAKAAEKALEGTT